MRTSSGAKGAAEAREGRAPAVRDADADRRFRAYAGRHGWAPDERFVGGYVDWEWRHARHAYDGLVTRVRGKKVLEFGCHVGGTSVVLAALGARVEAVDVEHRYVELTRLNAERHKVGARVRARLVPDTTRLPFGDAEFDLVSCNSVFEYVPSDALEGVLRELDRVLTPGGHVVVLGTSNRLWPYEPHTRRWLTNYVPLALHRLLFAGPRRAGVSPWRLRAGFGERYVDVTRRDGGRLLVALKAKMGASPGRLKLLAAANRLLCPLGAHAGLVTPTITMVLKKRGILAPSAADSPARPHPSGRPVRLSLVPSLRRKGATIMSDKRTYAVTAAYGRIGRRVAAGLLAAGHRVRALGADRAKLDELAGLGAEPFVGDLSDGAYLERAFRGADAAFLLAPGSRNRGARDYRREFGDFGIAYARAARATGLRKALFISTVGAHDERYRGFIMIHGDVERALDEVEGLDVVHLRAPAFFENLFYFLPATRARGALVSPIAPDSPLDTAGTADVAAAALRLLLELDFRGKTAVELHGRPGLTMAKIAGLVGQQLGRPFAAEQAPRDEDIEALVAAGLGRDFATMINDTWHTFSRYGLLRAAPPVASIAAPTPIETFLRDELVPAILAPDLPHEH